VDVCEYKQWRTHEFFSGWVQQIKLRSEDTENGDLGAVAPYSGVPLNLQMNETRILIRLLQMYIPRNWELGTALAKLRNFRGGLNPLSTPLSIRNTVSSRHFINLTHNLAIMLFQYLLVTQAKGYFIYLNK
jgi:hypothetical protein